MPAGQADPGGRRQLRRPHHHHHQLRANRSTATASARSRRAFAACRSATARSRPHRTEHGRVHRRAGAGRAGIIVPPSASACGEICSRRRSSIADEVQIGLGRTGRILARDHEGARRPDARQGARRRPAAGHFAPARSWMAVFAPATRQHLRGNPLGAAVGEAALTPLEHGPLRDRRSGNTCCPAGAIIRRSSTSGARASWSASIDRPSPAPAGSGAVDEGVLTKDTLRHGGADGAAADDQGEQIDQAVAALGPLERIAAAEPIASKEDRPHRTGGVVLSAGPGRERRRRRRRSRASG